MNFSVHVQVQIREHTVSGHNWYTSETPFKWRFPCGLMVANFQIFTGPVFNPHNYGYFGKQ